MILEKYVISVNKDVTLELTVPYDTTVPQAMAIVETMFIPPHQCRTASVVGIFHNLHYSQYLHDAYKN